MSEDGVPDDPEGARAVERVIEATADDELWADYINGRSRSVRDRLIVRYSTLVKIVASRLAVGLPHSVEQADLVSYGVFGLIDAIEKFDPSRGIKFETYAMTRIRGAIIDELRSVDWVPRSVRAKARAVESALAKLEADLGRSPTDGELAGELGVSHDELKRILAQISLAGMVALDDVLSGGERRETLTVGDLLADRTGGPTDAYEVEETKRVLAGLINRLDERERTVVRLYYYDGLTLGAIGRILQVTESRVCQIHTKAVLHLRNRMELLERESA